MTLTIEMPGRKPFTRRFNRRKSVAFAIDTILPGQTAYLVSVPGLNAYGVQLISSRKEGVVIKTIVVKK